MKFMNMLRQPYLDEFESTGGDGFDSDIADSDGFDDESTESAVMIDKETPEEKPADEEEKPAEDTKPAEETPKTFKVKYNHQEIEVPEDQAGILIQKGMGFDKAIERAQQEGIDKYIASFGYTNPVTGELIKSKAEYDQALHDKEIYERYQSQGLPDEFIQELMESKKFREESKAEKARQEEARIEFEKQEAIKKDAVDFFSWFKAENGRAFDVEKDTMPPEIWQAHLNGANLIAEYAKYENKILKQRTKTLSQNNENLKRTPVGGVTSHGSDKPGPDDAFLQGFDEEK
jgi:hypothetical protein